MICVTAPSSSSSSLSHQPSLRRGGTRLFVPNVPPARLILASQSPRRRQLLTDAGLHHEAVHPGVDDAQLIPQANPDKPLIPEHWTAALAFLKASAAASRVQIDEDADEPTVIIAADTIVWHRGQVIGQPKDRDDAARILDLLDDDAHDVVTGVALLDPRTNRRDLFADRAVVNVGQVGRERIDEYLATGLWRGKAGAYNLSERLTAGWPITFTGDAGTIMGLPVQLLTERLARFTHDADA